MIVVLKRYSWGLHFLTIALASYLIAQALATSIASRLAGDVAGAPVSSPTRQLQPVEEGGEREVDDYSIIAMRNVFDSSASGIVETSPQEPAPALLGEGGPAVKTTLEIKLLGTIVVDGGADRRSSAAVSSGKGKGVDVYFIGDENSFADNVRLTKVRKGRIEFLNGSRLEYAEMEDFASSKSIFQPAEKVHGEGGLGDSPVATAEGPEGEVLRQGDRFVIDQATIDETLSNLDRFYTEVRIVPHFKEGKVSGMKILSVKPGSIVAKLGLKRGDILEKINGQELDVKRGMALFGELRDQKNFTIDLIRGGQNKTLEYEVR